MVIALSAKAVGTMTSSPYTKILSRVFLSGAAADNKAQIVNAITGKQSADPIGANFLSANLSPLGNVVDNDLQLSK
jgi:hypothetical protein